MAYRIDYPGKKKKRGFSAWLLLAAVPALLALPKQRIVQWLLPGDPEITVRALSELVQTLRQGSNAGDAVAAFCRSIIHGAGLG